MAPSKSSKRNVWLDLTEKALLAKKDWRSTVGKTTTQIKSENNKQEVFERVVIQSVHVGNKLSNLSSTIYVNKDGAQLNPERNSKSSAARKFRAKFQRKSKKSKSPTNQVNPHSK